MDCFRREIPKRRISGLSFGKPWLAFLIQYSVSVTVQLGEGLLPFGCDFNRIIRRPLEGVIFLDTFLR